MAGLDVQTDIYGGDADQTADDHDVDHMGHGGIQHYFLGDSRAS